MANKALFFLPVILFVVLSSCNQPDCILMEVKHLQGYPSGSALAVMNNKLFLVGDDASYMLVMNNKMETIDSVILFPGDNGRLSKETKPDMESATSFLLKKKQTLLLLGSGSVEPYRENGILWSPGDSTVVSTINVHQFYKRLMGEGIKELNIEGSAAIPGGMVLANRGNKNFSKNYLVFTSLNFFYDQEKASIKLVQVGVNIDTAIFNGVSGLDYANRSDKLLLSVSTENNYDNYSDGTIGKSYLWIIDDISGKKRFTHLNPDKIIDLESIDHRFKGHKIESVCLLNETRTKMELLLAADDDKGDTWLFLLQLNKQN